jgi:hypothetical protein
MHVLYQPQDPQLYESLLFIAQNAMESPNSNMRMQAGSVTLTCTANTLQTAPVTFDKPFRKGIKPFLFLFPNPVIASSSVTPSRTGLTETGFTAQAYSSVTQSVEMTYIAFGQV